MLKRAGLLLPIILKVGLGFSQDFSQIDSVFYKAFDSVVGTFVLYDLEENNYYYFNEERAETRFPPMSTFKIPNSLIALETGVLENANSLIRWDSIKVPCNTNWNFYPATEWCRDQTLASAFRYSVVWYFQEVARRIGHENMATYLQKLHYGNQDINAGIDNFWFWKLKISAKEQIEFLKKFYLEEIDFEPEHISTMEDIMTIEDTGQYVLYGKTGGGEIGENLAIGWFVGFVETDDNVYFFAINIEGENYLAVRDKRQKIVREILTKLSIL